MKTIIRNGNIFDTDTPAFTGAGAIAAEDGKIVSAGEASTGDADA